MLSRRSLFQMNLDSTDSDQPKAKQNTVSDKASSPQETTLDGKDGIEGASNTISPAALTAPVFTLALAACGGGGGGSAPPTSPAPTPPPVAVVKKPGSDAEAVRFLTRAQFSVNSAEITKVKDVGYVSWLDSEVAKPVSETAVAAYNRL
ncbi:MAG: hypothetical protein ACRC2U_08810, partial [Aeromonas sp.]